MRSIASETRAHLGFTLIELLLVMGMLSIVLGVGIGMMSSLNPGERVAVGLVRNILRTAHNTAIARNAPARVRIDAKSGSLYAEGQTVVGTWHFESEPVRGAFELDGVFLGGGYLDNAGFQGRALSFRGEPNESRFEVPVQNDPAFDFRRGFGVEFAVRVDEAADARLITIGRSFFVQVTRVLGISANFIPRVEDELGVPKAGGRVWVKAPPASLRLGRYARVKIEYDRKVFAITVDGVLVASVPDESEVWSIDEPLIVGGGRTAFPGALDNLVVSAVSGEESVSLPDGVQFPVDTPAEVLFAADGSLDPALHAAPVVIGVEFEDGRRESVQVGLYGTVE